MAWVMLRNQQYSAIFEGTRYGSQQKTTLPAIGLPKWRGPVPSTCRVKVSYLGLVRNVLGCREEEMEVSAGITVRELLARLVEKHGDSFRHSVFRSEGELRSTALVCVDDRDIAELQGFETKLESGERLSVVVGVYPPEGG